MNTFWDKYQKMEENAQPFEKLFFYKQVLDSEFRKILCRVSKLRNFVKITGP